MPRITSAWTEETWRSSFIGPLLGEIRQALAAAVVVAAPAAESEPDSAEKKAASEDNTSSIIGSPPRKRKAGGSSSTAQQHSSPTSVVTASATATAAGPTTTSTSAPTGAEDDDDDSIPRAWACAPTIRFSGGYLARSSSGCCWELFHYRLPLDPTCDWEVVNDDDGTGRVMYFNRRTHRTSWNKPKEMESQGVSQTEGATLVATLKPRDDDDDDDGIGPRTAVLPPLGAVESVLRRAEFMSLLVNALCVLKGERNNNQLASLLVSTRGASQLDLIPVLATIVDDDGGDENDDTVYVDEAKEILRVLLAYSATVRCSPLFNGNNDDEDDDDKNNNGLVMEGWTITQAGAGSEDSSTTTPTPLLEKLTEGWLEDNRETAKSFVRACLQIMNSGDDTLNEEEPVRQSSSKKRRASS